MLTIYKSKYKFVEGRFNDYSIGDLAHYEFTLRNGKYFDFGNCKDLFYDFDADSEGLKGKNFLIFYEDVQFNDPYNGPYTSSVIYHLIPLDKQNKENSTHKESKLTFDELYPILKKNLLDEVCEESLKTTEEKNSLVAFSKETDFFLSSWKWDLKNNPIVVKDIDNDGLIDYTIELTNEGGGCGGNIGQEERWTLFGTNPDKFVFTHIIPYRSQTGK